MADNVQVTGTMFSNVFIGLRPVTLCLTGQVGSETMANRGVHGGVLEGNPQLAP